MPISKPIYQLQLPLDLPEEVLSDQPSGISPEEARLRSETARAALNNLSAKDAPWKEEYVNLIEGGWNWRVAAYIAWASCPKDSRMPKTQDELAIQHLGLTSDRAINTWRKKNQAIDEMVAVLQSSPLWEHRASYYQALDKGAKRAGDDYKFFRHLQLALELLGDYVSTSKIEAELNQRLTGDLASLPFKDKLKLAGLDKPEELTKFIESLRAHDVSALEEDQS